MVKKERHPSDFYLIGFLLTQAAIPLHLLINYGDAVRIIALNASPNLYRIFEIAYWLEAPLLLWYTRSLVYKNYQWSKVDLLFILPAAVYLIFTIFSFYTLDYTSKYLALRDYQALDAPILRHLNGFVRESIRVIFGVMCVIDIRHCRQQIRKRYSNVDQIDLGWLNTLVVAFLVIRVWAVFVSIALILTAHLEISVDFELMGLIGNYTTFMLVSGLIFFSLMSSSLFEGVETRKETEAEEKIEKEQAKSEIDPDLIARIESHMRSSKPFLAHILTLERLAKQLGMPQRTLSNAINRHFDQNFFEFVNHYRVEEAKTLLADPEQKGKTMIDVMADCGFNSKATFNTFFKKVVGSTPSQYRAEQLKGQQ